MKTNGYPVRYRAPRASASGATVTLSALVAAMVIMPRPAVSADGCYTDGHAARQAGRLADAIAAFDAAARRPECIASRAGLLFNKAETLGQLAEASGEDTYACEAERAYRAIAVSQPASTRIGAAARAGLERVKGRCAAQPTPDRTLAWSLTVGSAVALVAGGVSYGLAADAIDSRRAADARALAEEPGSDTRRAALADFHDASDRANGLGLTAYALGGIGLALAVGAAVVWLDDEGAASGPALVPSIDASGYRGLSLGGVW